MVDNSKMTVLECLKPLILSAVGNGDRMLRNKYFCCLQVPGGGGGNFL